MEKHFAVIGYPIEQSPSPWMHNEGYKALNIAAVYQRFLVEPERLAEAVDGLCALGFSGWNVTIPHKEKIIPLLDVLTPEAKRAGAVNVVKIQEGQRIGHNTDGMGFIRSVRGILPELKGKKAVLLGAGGAAKGIAIPLAEEGAQILILNRTPEKARLLAEQVRQAGGTAETGAFAPGDWLKDADILIQTTSAGLQGEDYPFSLQGIAPETLAADIIFKPEETAFLREARELGCRKLDGLGMLLYQGVYAWEFWLGGQAPVGVMERALRGHGRPG